jgi:hypothetical protein
MLKLANAMVSTLLVVTHTQVKVTALLTHVLTALQILKKSLPMATPILALVLLLHHLYFSVQNQKSCHY